MRPVLPFLLLLVLLTSCWKPKRKPDEPVPQTPMMVTSTINGAVVSPVFHDSMSGRKIVLHVFKLLKYTYDENNVRGTYYVETRADSIITDNTGSFSFTFTADTFNTYYVFDAYVDNERVAFSSKWKDYTTGGVKNDVLLIEPRYMSVYIRWHLSDMDTGRIEIGYPNSETSVDLGAGSTFDWDVNVDKVEEDSVITFHLKHKNMSKVVKEKDYVIHLSQFTPLVKDTVNITQAFFQ